MKNQINHWNPKTFLHRFSILAISLVITTGSAISPALPAMESTFSNYPKSIVDMVATIQQIPAFIVLLFSSQLALRFGIKRMISLGVLLMGISGMAPMFLNNLWLILGSRIIFGIGIGMINSLAVTIIELLYDKNDQAQMLGNRTAFEPIGVCITNLVIGMLLNISWHISFLSYGLIIVVWFLFIRMIPDISMTSNSNNGEANHKERINLPVIGAGFFCAMMTMGSSILNVLTPSIMVDHHLGTATQSSYVLALLTIMGMVFGFLFGIFFKLLHHLMLPMGVGLLIIGLLIFNYASNIWIFILGLVIAGVSYAFAGTYVFNLMSSVAPKNSTGLANSILLVGCNIGTAIAPVVIGFLGLVSPFGGFVPGIGIYLIVSMIVLIGILFFQLTHHSVQN